MHVGDEILVEIAGDEMGGDGGEAGLGEGIADPDRIAAKGADGFDFLVAHGGKLMECAGEVCFQRGHGGEELDADGAVGGRYGWAGQQA